MQDRIAVVGDVHGSASALTLAVDWLMNEWDGHVVFVGDYINRGHNSRGVMEALLNVRSAFGERLTLLMGNHDAVLLDFLEGRSRDRFLAHGGLQTINSYLGSKLDPDPFGQFKSEFPASHLDLLQSLKVSFETSDVLVTHSGFNPARPKSRAVEDVVFGRFRELFEPGLETPRPLVVCGHYVQRNLQAFCSPRLICLDSGCGTVPGAPLSVILLPTRELHTFTGET